MKHIQPISIVNTKWVLTLFGIAIMFCAQAQDGVGINTTTIDPHAILDINLGGSTPKGIKFPSLPASTALQDMNGANPGIMFFDSESNQIFNSIEVDNGVYGWDPVGWGMRGTANTDINKHALGTTDNTGLKNKHLRIVP